MSYDKDKLHIKIDGDENQFRDDLFAHFANVADLAKNDMKANAKTMTQKQQKMHSGSFGQRLQALPKPTKAVIMAFVFWSAFVIFRTSDDYDLVGLSLDQWDDDVFFLNWLLPPAILFALTYSFRWVLSDKQGLAASVSSPSSAPNLPIKTSPLIEFEREISNWPDSQAKTALLVIKATLTGNSKQAETLIRELNVSNMYKVLNVIKELELHSKKTE